MTNTFFRARYLISSYLPLEQAAAVLAGEQSSGTFTRVRDESAELKARHGARVVGLTPVEPPLEQLPGALNPNRRSTPDAALLDIDFPVENIGTSLPSLLNTVAGNLYELREFAAVKLLDLEIPQPVLDRYPGPSAGIAGTSRLVSPDHRGAVVGTIVKPSVGLPLDKLGKLVEELALAGLDFIKDDELNADPSYAPLADRIATVMPAIHRAAEITGKKTMYAFNISDDIDVMLHNVELVQAAGGTSVMVTVPTVGLPGLRAVRAATDLPIHGHRAGFEGFGRSNALGMDYTVFQKLARLAGADHLHVGGVNSKFFESNDSVLASIRAIQAPLGTTTPALPVLSSGQSAATAQATYELVGSDQLMVLAGGGITGHPDGPAAGVASMRSAWNAVADGRAVSDAAAEDQPLQSALAAFGAR
ncbi:ribulose 1,5-bisphosphate carboxylase [Curtobacterium sp. MCPF17_018]|uniref:RuBisCO large subunit C-terminal-like domain-containing protein n=1 Tax=Curtobacterium sp. MCPF17_018 TaxID=2175638 RepID=UPI000DAAB9F6|nr:RuBisCO large subunit C-terminal-like domain-containing protein [Curtobacterium sp. MCPF17_018]PZE69293.1 ribulose 1,5-bisphosphate carboxylase [Curtobacterium sp. MCPF17_018]